MRCQSCGGQLVVTVSEPMGEEWVCIDCGEPYEVKF